MSDHAAIEIVEPNDAAGTTEEEQFETAETPPHAPPVGSPDDTVTRCLAQVKRLLQEAPGGSPAETSPQTIFRIPQPLRGIDPKAEEPEIVSIGPYHREQPQVLVFERLKPHFLERFLHRTKSDLKGLAEFVAGEESSARSRYSEHVDMTSSDFVQMMLLDSCFVLELLLRFFGSEATDEDDPIFARPQIIPILIRNLLKLENQIPYYILHSLFNRAVPSNLIGERGSLAILALKLFNQAYPRPMALFKSWENLEGEHLLDLFYKSLSPARPKSTKESRLLAQSVPCVTELRPSRIYFESEKADSLLDISFHERILQIPEIAINDFMTTVLINCVSLEQCRENRSKYMTDYVSIMHCLINQPKDVSLLRSDGIIALYSRDDQYVADLFSKLGKSISFNVHDCFLSKQFEELESYYRSNRAKMMCTYLSCPWSFISLFSAFLIVVLSITQTVMAILAYLSPR